MLKEAIESVLAQSLKDLEVLVVDDCSTDGTEEFVKNIHDERVHYFRNESNSGSEASRNLGFRNAKGKYITFLDDDDYFTDYDFFRNATEIHERNKNSLSIVCADGISLEAQTGIKTPHSPGQPGRIKGTDFILKQGHEYIKPLSLFPAVFSAESLRQAGLAYMMIFDSQTYMLAALYGDVFIMKGTVGIYRVHNESNTLGRKNNTAYNSRRYANFAERLRQNHIVKEKLYTHENKKASDNWYISAVLSDISFFAAQKKGLTDSFNIYKTAMKNADFMPKLWLMLPFIRLKANVRALMRKIAPLRKIYRRIKYGKNYGINI